MSEKHKTDVEKLTEAMSILPEDKRSFLIGYAEGVIAARKKRRKAQHRSITSIAGMGGILDVRNILHCAPNIHLLRCRCHNRNDDSILTRLQ